MGEVSVTTSAYAKLILHAAKYPHCAVSGVLLADATKIKDGAKNQDFRIVDAIPLFHHSHYVSPMAEIALSQIETVAQDNNQVIAGFYAACENFKDNTVDKCPGQKIAEKIVEYFPSAAFVVIDNKRIMKHHDSPAIKVHKFSEGKWKLKDTPGNKLFTDPKVLVIVSYLLQNDLESDLVDFDDYLDDLSLDYTNIGIDKLIEEYRDKDSL